jgi:hypothetical protein
VRFGRTPAQSNDEVGKPWSRVTGFPVIGPSWRTNNSCGEPLMARLTPPEIQESSVVFTGAEPNARALLDEVWVAAQDLIEQRLGLEPSGPRSPNELASLKGDVVRYQFRRSRSHGDQLYLT